MVLGCSRWVLRLALLTEGALLLFGVAQNPMFSVNSCQDFISAALVVQLSFRILGRSIRSNAGQLLMIAAALRVFQQASYLQSWSVLTVGW